MAHSGSGSGSDSDISSTALDTLDSIGHVARAVWAVHWSWYFAWLGRILVLPLRLVWIPLSYVAGALLTLFSPALYVLSYILACVNTVVAFAASLEPLYIFFAVAATVGIIAGVTLGVSSSIITSYVGLQDDQDEDERRPPSPGKGGGKSHLQYSQSFHEGSSSAERNWRWDSSARRRPAAGLLSQTIHEEDDDSES